MHMGPVSGIVSSAAGAPLSQTQGSETERAKQDANAIQRQVAGEEKTEKATGIGETEQDEGASDRDADGRRLWEPGAKGQQKHEDRPSDPAAENSPPPVKDPSGESGNTLDLTG